MVTKKLGNKGFSLVELIIVVAIMAIIAGAIAPLLIRYLERSRESTDVTNMRNCKTAAEAAFADGNMVIGGKYYYQENGEISDLPPKSAYGKGKSTDGKTEYDNYDSTQDVTGLYLCIDVNLDSTLDIYWGTGSGGQNVMNKLQNVFGKTLTKQSQTVGWYIATNKPKELNEYIASLNEVDTQAVITQDNGKDNHYGKDVLNSMGVSAKGNIKIVSVTSDGSKLSDHKNGDKVPVVQYLYYEDGKNVTLYGVRETDATITQNWDNGALDFDKSDNNTASSWKKID